MKISSDISRSNNLRIVRFFLAAEVLKLALDATPSSINEQMWDTPAAATNWLKTFAINNEEILKESDVDKSLCIETFDQSLNLVSNEIYLRMECSRINTCWNTSTRFDWLCKRYI